MRAGRVGRLEGVASLILPALVALGAVLIVKMLRNSAGLRVAHEITLSSTTSIPRPIQPQMYNLPRRKAAEFRAEWNRRGVSQYSKPAKDVTIVAHGRTSFAGGVWMLLTYKSETSSSCATEVVPSEGKFVYCFRK